MNKNKSKTKAEAASKTSKDNSNLNLLTKTPTSKGASLRRAHGHASTRASSGSAHGHASTRASSSSAHGQTPTETNPGSAHGHASTEASLQNDSGPNISPSPRLSGAARRRFAILVAKGMDRVKAKEQCVHPLSSYKRTRGSRDETTPDAKKHRGRAKLAGPNKVNQAGPSSSSTKPNAVAHRHKQISYKDAMQGIRMAVLMRTFPNDLMNTEQLDMAGQAILDKIEEQREDIVKPKFLNSTYKAGYLMLLCKDNSTVDWLKKYAIELKPWEGAELWATLESNIPQAKTLIGYFPNSANLSHERVLHRIQGQNAGLKIDRWRVLRKEDRGTTSLMVLSIDQTSADNITAQDLKLSYGFREVPVKIRGPQDPPTSEETEVMDVTECNTSASESPILPLTQ